MAGRSKGLHRTLIQRSRSVPAAEKAAFHQISGAGKSHVKREFFGLNESDENAIVQRIEQQLERVLKG